jgi:heme/copper-type cytochrome/quinol oxidase subunit 2
MPFRIIAFLMGLAVLPLSTPAHAETLDRQIALENHAFVPAELDVPADRKIKLTVKNGDAATAEFESYELNREIVVPPHGQIVVYIDALDPGTYSFFDDFHRDTKGTIVAK